MVWYGIGTGRDDVLRFWALGYGILAGGARSDGVVSDVSFEV